MEGFYYGFLVLFLTITFLFGTGSFLLNFGSGKKEKQWINLLLIIIPVLVFMWNPISNTFTFKPAQSDLIGTYIIVNADNDIPKSDYHKYVLKLSTDSSFFFTPTPGIDLCGSGHYELDYDYVYNELSFQCGLGWTPQHIKRKIGGFEIVFYLNFDTGSNISFEKIKN